MLTMNVRCVMGGPAERLTCSYVDGDLWLSDGFEYTESVLGGSIQGGIAVDCAYSEDF